MFSSVGLRVSLMSAVMQCFARFAGTRERRRYCSRFSSYNSCFVRCRRPHPFSSIALLLSRRDPAFSLFVHRSVVSISISVTCCFALPSRFSCRFRFPFVVFVVRDRSFGGEHRLSFGFLSSYVLLRPVRLRSLARSLIAVFAMFPCSFVAPRTTMPPNVEKVTPVASSSAGNQKSNAVPPVESVPSVPSSVPAPSSNVAGPSTAPVVTPTSSAGDAMMT